MITSKSDFRCPRCKAELSSTSEGLRCTGCSAQYRVEDGIVDLRCGRLDYYFNPVPREAMNQLIDDAEHEPWPAIIRRFMAHVNDNSDWLDNLVVDSRYAWKLCLELPHDAKVLDLGCGLGNLSKNIAPHVAEVFALDLTWERLKFAKRCFERFNRDDRIVLVAGGDGTYLPFPDGYFDCVALSGVLEWIADTGNWGNSGSSISKAGRMFMSIFGESNPRRMQMKFLAEVRRILKPGGQIFVGIENRLNYEYFGQRPDHHTGLWFGSLLPRFAANLYSIAVNKQPYRTYTHSLRGLRRLFQASGFAEQEFLGFLNGYSHLSEIVPLETSNDDIWQAPNVQGLAGRIRREKHFVPAYGIIASASKARPKSVLRRIVSSINDTLPVEHSPLVITDFRITGKEKAVLRGTAGDLPIIISIPCNHFADAAQERHYRFLERAVDLDGLGAFVPRHIARGEIQKISYYVEQQLAGRPLRDELSNQGRTALLPGISSLLRAINPVPAGDAPTSLVGADFQRLVEQPLMAVVECLDDPDLAHELRTTLGQRLLGLKVHQGLVHGDFSVHNIFVHEGRVSGLIDWEGADSSGLPIVDALNYLDSMHRALHPGLTLLDTIPLLAKGDWPVEAERRFLAEIYEYFGLDAKHHREFVALYWLSHVRSQLDFSLACNRVDIKQRIDLVGRELLRLL